MGRGVGRWGKTWEEVWDSKWESTMWRMVRWSWGREKNGGRWQRILMNSLIAGPCGRERKREREAEWALFQLGGLWSADLTLHWAARRDQQRCSASWGTLFTADTKSSHERQLLLRVSTNLSCSPGSDDFQLTRNQHWSSLLTSLPIATFIFLFNFKS